MTSGACSENKIRLWQCQVESESGESSVDSNERWESKRSVDRMRLSTATVTNTIFFAKWVRLHEAMDAHACWGLDDSAQPAPSKPPCVLTMKDDSKQPEWRDGVVSSLNMAIDGLNLAKGLSKGTPAQAVCGTAAVLLTMIRVSSLLSATKYVRFTHGQDTMVNERDYVDLGLFCADICGALARGMNGKKMDDLSKSVCDAINQLTT